MKNPKRARVVTGIYQDACGFLATVSQGGRRQDKRFPPNTPIPVMERWRFRTRADLADAHVPLHEREAELGVHSRLDELFHVLKVIRRSVDETHDLAERAIQHAATDRALAEQLHDAARGGEWGSAFHTLCLRLIDERETLAKELERIRSDLDHVGIEPRTKNVGAGARGAHPKGGD